MEENTKSKRLPTGTATPYVAIFNARGEVIRDPESNITLGSLVTLFEYIYEEAKTDKGHLEISTDNPNLCALNDLGYQQGLQLQWGYIYPDGTGYYSPVRRVIIVGQKVTFGQRGINMTIEFTDYSELLKNIPASHYDTTRGFVEYFKDLCKGALIGIEIVDHQSQPQIVPKVAKRVTDGSEIRQENPEFEDVLNTGTPTDPIDPKNNLHHPTTSNPGAAGIKLLEFNPETQQLTYKDTDTFKKVYLKDTQERLGVILGTSRNKYYQIKDAIGGLANGPYFMDSRDNRLVIHNMQDTRKIVRIYDYQGGTGELLEFSVESKFVKSSTEVKSSTDVNPDDKSIDTTMVQEVVDPDQGNEDGKDLDIYMDWGKNNPAIKRPQRVSPDTVQKDVMGGPEITMKVIQAAKDNEAYQKETQALQQKSFKTLAAAKQYYREHPQVSQEEIDQYFQGQLTKWKEEANKPMDPSKGLDKIPPFKIKRKVVLHTKLYPETLSYRLSSDPSRSTKITSEEFVNAVQSGQIDLTNSLYQLPLTDSVSKDYINTYREKGISLLSSVPGVRVLNKTTSNGQHTYEFIYETEFTLELNGVDTIAGANSINLGNSFANAVTDSVSNQVKAQAQVIGDPVLESSMNFEIRNVSDKFQGLWYSKKVIHTISDQGYMCNIEFVQRTIPVSTVTLKSTISKKDYAKELIQAAKQASKSKTSEIVTQISKEIKAQRKQSPDKTVISWIDPRTGQAVYGQTDLQSGSYIVRTPDKIEYNPSEVYQDLQKRR